MRALAKELAPRRVATDRGAKAFAVEHVEALAFAWLAREALAGRPGNLPAVTGAHGPARARRDLSALNWGTDRMPSNPSRRTARVTGSTSGIGAEIAEAFAREGLNVILNGFGEAAGWTAA